MDAVLILNQMAGSLNGDLDAVTPEALRDAFAAAGARITVQPAAPRQVATLVRAALAQGPGAIFVGGGDGTISTAAAALAGTGVPLGVLPLGTLNHFARDLGLPTAWRDAVKALVRGSPRAVDVGEVNGCPFINNCSIGPYPEAVRRRDALRRERGRGKWIAMALASLKVFRQLRRFRVRIEIPDTTLALRTPFVFVGNNRYSGHLLNRSLRPRLDEGLLSIYTTRADRRLALLRLVWQSMARSIDAADALETHTATMATLTSPAAQSLPLAVDGELANLQLPLRFRIRPGALHVIAPPPAESQA